MAVFLVAVITDLNSVVIACSSLLMLLLKSILLFIVVGIHHVNLVFIKKFQK